MTDRIILDRIAVFARHGALPEEERLGQRFYLSLDAELDLSEAGRTDDLGRSVSYAALAERAIAIATSRRFALIEALADAIAADAIAAFPRLTALTVRVDKPGAPVPVVLDSVAVVIRRERAGASNARRDG